MPTRSTIHPRDAILAAIERIYRYRMTTTSGGNISVRDGQDVWITPARLDKGSLRRTDIVCRRADGSCDGPHRPSSEWPFHEAVYRARPEYQAVVHAHPVALVAFSMTRQVPETRLFPQAREVCGPVGFAPYALPGSTRLAENIAATFAAGHDCVVLENHGVVVGGATLDEALARFEALEFAALTIIKARALGAVRYLDEPQLEQARRRRVDLAPVEPPPATSSEQELRRQLSEFVRRGCRQRLLISTEGSFSARIDQRSFLITPSGRDRNTLTIDDLVWVGDGVCERGKSPSRASRAHAALYARHDWVQSIVMAHPVHATAFSVTSAALDSRTIPESYLFLRDVPRIEYGRQYGDPAALVDRVGSTQPVALLENDGVLVLGSSVLDAFDRLEVLESTAEALVHAKSLGPVASMPPEVIDELRQAFGIE